MKVGNLPRSVRAGAVLVLLGWVAAGAWRSIPPPRHVFDPPQLPINAFFTRDPQARLMPPKMENGEVLPSGLRLHPGGTMEFDLARWQGVLWGRFQAIAPAGATIEVAAKSETRTVLIIRRQLDPQNSQADGQPFVLFVDPAALPNLTTLVIRAPVTSPGSVEWSEIRLAKEEELSVQRTAPFRVLAYDGLYAPLGEDKALYVHAPANLALVIPAGRRRFTTAFGFNPSVLAKPDSASDGIGFALRLDPLGSEGTALFQGLVEPGARGAIHELQRTTVLLENREPSILRLVVDPGPKGNIGWDSAMWRDFVVEEAPAP